MNELCWQHGKIEETLEEISDVSEVKIATAFFSTYGLKILKKSLRRIIYRNQK